MATNPHDPLLSEEDFLQIDFGPDLKAELDRGVIRMVGGGTFRHSRIQMNLTRFVANALRGSGCRPHGSDMAIRTIKGSIRYPDLTIDCARPADEARERFLTDPRVIFEVLSPSTRTIDLDVKLAKYRVIAAVASIVFVDPDAATVAVTHRTAGGGWSDLAFTADDLALPALGLVVPHAEVFAED